MFRQVSEEQRKITEDRYKDVLMEAVQDAVFLSAQNQQLQADNKRLRKGQRLSFRNARRYIWHSNVPAFFIRALAEMKDSITARGDNTKHSSQHGPA